MREKIEKIAIFALELIQNDMNLRDIKKDIDYVLSAFIEDCTLVAAVNSKVSEDKASDPVVQDRLRAWNHRAGHRFFRDGLQHGKRHPFPDRSQ